MTVLTPLISFIVAVAILVAIHEYGHFWVARRCGVKVLKFSIGFGRPLWSKTGKDGVEYVIAAIPLGGYVKMLDARETEVMPSEQQFEFTRQNVWKRIAIVIAGPVANFIFAVFAFFAVFLIGVEGLKPIVGEPKQGTPAAQAGLISQDHIVAIGGVKIDSWQSLSMEVMTQGLRDGHLTLTVLREGSEESLRIDAESIANDPENGISSMGLRPWMPTVPAIVGEVEIGGAADAAGILEGDRIASLNGEPISTWTRFVEVVQENPLKILPLVVLRDALEVELELQPLAKDTNVGRIGYVGLGPFISEEITRQYQANRITIEYGPFESMVLAVKRTWDTSITILTVFYKMIIGEASVKHLGGPFNIAEHAGKAAQAGPIFFLSLLAFISVSLGVLNLLPVPVLDGGHLLYYVCELILGRPVSEATQAMGQRVGLAMIMLLMSVALFNDFSRLLQ